MSRCYACCQENCGYRRPPCTCECHVREEVLSSVTVDDELKEVQITGNAKRMLEEVAKAEGCTPREALKKMITEAWSRGEQN